MNLEIVFLILLFLVAFLYSSVGHGGASGYLALMAFFAFAPNFMRSSALILNMIVSGIAFLQYYRGKHFNWRLFWPFALTSIPAAFAGGMFSIDALVYKKVLGVLLIFPIIKLLSKSNEADFETDKNPVIFSLVIGSVIGFLSGLIGIGGGIILSPVILLLHWGNMKQTAAVSALFILVNSIAGFCGILFTGFVFENGVMIMLLIAFVGGLAGSYFGSLKIKSGHLKRMLAFVLVIACLKLIFT